MCFTPSRASPFFARQEVAGITGRKSPHYRINGVPGCRFRVTEPAVKEANRREEKKMLNGWKTLIGEIVDKCGRPDGPTEHLNCAITLVIRQPGRALFQNTLLADGVGFTPSGSEAATKTC